MEDLQAALALEQTAHRRAVQQYVDALDARSAMALQLQDAQHALSELQACHDALQRQHAQLQQQHVGLIGRCRVVRDVCQRSNDALSLDQQLAQQVQQWQAQQPKHDGDSEVQSVENTAAGSDSGASQASQDFECADLQPLAELLDQHVQAVYASWRSAVDVRDAALTEGFRMADQLRDTQEAAHQAAQQQGVLQRMWDEAQQQLAAGQVGVLLHARRGRSTGFSLTRVWRPNTTASTGARSRPGPPADSRPRVPGAASAGPG